MPKYDKVTTCNTILKAHILHYHFPLSIVWGLMIFVRLRIKRSKLFWFKFKVVKINRHISLYYMLSKAAFRTCQTAYLKFKLVPGHRGFHYPFHTYCREYRFVLRTIQPIKFPNLNLRS